MKAQIIFVTIAIVLIFSSSIAEAISPGWSEPTRITTHWLGDSTPALIQDKNGTFWVAWRSARSGPDGDIWMSTSTDGVNWSVPIMVTEDSSSDAMPSLIQDSGGIYWLAFTNGSPKDDISIQNSSDGITWNTPIPVVADAYDDFWPSLMQNSTGAFWIVWESMDRDPDDRIYYTSSLDGMTWSTPQNLSDATYLDYNPDIIQDSNGTYWLVWGGYLCCGYAEDTLIRNSSDGINWSPQTVIFNRTGYWEHQILEYQGTYWLVWYDPSDWNMHFSTSSNGINWSSPTRITTNISSTDSNPEIIYDSNGTIWIAWSSARTGNGDIYITHSTVTLTSPLGGEVWNGTQNITWVSVSGDYQNDSFSLYYSTNGTDWTLIQSGIPADDAYTNKSYEWNTTNVSDGANYTIKIIRVHPLHNESDISGVFTIDNIDTEPPSVSNILPANGSYVGGMQYINATVVDVISGAGSVVANVSNGTWSRGYVLSYGSANLWYNDSWNTTQQGDGVYNISINATDNLGYSNDTEYVTVTVDNTPPAISMVNPSPVEKGDEANLTITITEFQPDTFQVLKNGSQVDAGSYSSGVSFNVSVDSSVDTAWNYTVYANDTAGNVNSSTVWVVVEDTTLPIITLISPSNNTADGDGNVTFSYNVTDASSITNCSLVLDEVINQTDTSITNDTPQNFSSNLGSGSYSWSINCSDSAGNTGGSETRVLAVILSNEFGGDSTDLSSADVSNITNFVLDSPNYGKINFSGIVDLSAGADLNAHVNISYNRIEINSTALPALNRSAALYLRSLTFTNPRILRDGSVCPPSICTNKSYEEGTGTLTFDVEHFTIYSAEETPSPAQPSGGGGVSRPKIILLANSIDYKLSANFTALLKTYGIDAIYTMPENFSNYNTSGFIIILGGPDAPEGVGEIVQQILSSEEQNSVREPGSRQMFIKRDVWADGQTVFVFAGSDREQTKLASSENREAIKENVWKMG